MSNKIKLLKNNQKREWSDTEWVQEFYEFLQGRVPETIKLSRGHKPVLSKKQAFSIIWYLQEHFSIIPDNIERCDYCNVIFDSNIEGGYWEAKGKIFCNCCLHHVPQKFH